MCRAEDNTPPSTLCFKLSMIFKLTTVDRVRPSLPCVDATPVEIGTYIMLSFGAIVPATAAAWFFNDYSKQRSRPVVWFEWSFVAVAVALLAGVSALIGVGLG